MTNYYNNINRNWQLAQQAERRNQLAASRAASTRSAAGQSANTSSLSNMGGVGNLHNTISALGGGGPIQVDTFATSQQQDPLFGQQAQNLRSNIYNLGGQAYNSANRAAQDYAASARAAYENPFWGKALNEIQSVSPTMQAANKHVGGVLSGEYLQARPELMNAVRQVQATAARDAEDQNAQIRSRMGQAGMGFSTADAQSQQASSAAARARAEATGAQVVADNYGRERQNQEAAGQTAATLNAARMAQLGMGESMINSRTNLLSNVSQQFMQPLAQYASLLDLSRASNGGVENVQRKSPMDWAMMLAALPPQAGQSLQNALRGSMNPMQGVNWTRA
jgi:hypothetical protein